MLYMSSDAVASSIADRLGVSKSDILNPGADGGPDNAAVRLALAETRIIQETKEFLTQEGINVDAFDGKKGARSDTTMLVKNIPYARRLRRCRSSLRSTVRWTRSSFHLAVRSPLLRCLS